MTVQNQNLMIYTVKEINMHRYIELEDMINILAVGSYKGLTIDELVATLVDMDNKGILPCVQFTQCSECNNYVSSTGYCKLWKSYEHPSTMSCSCGEDISEHLS